MAIINLRDYYPFYTSDYFMEVPEDVVEMFKEFDRKEAAYRLRTYRHKAYYSLDRNDGIEHEALFVACLTYTHSTRLNRNIITAIISFGPTWPEAGESSKGSSFQGAAFLGFPSRQEGSWPLFIRTEKWRFSMVQSVTYQSEKQSVYFQGKLIVLENLIPVLSPDEKNKRKREIENHLYDVFSKYTDRFY